ncbi:MAG: OmpA family protein [Sedimentisphaerales bacterium]|nr:OmpA family protein [Sedimentisphaerales bacterium]
MQSAKSRMAVIFALITVIMLSGCTDWKKKYEVLNVEHQNLKGLLERERAEKGQLAEQAARDQQLIQDMQKQILEKKQSAADATGFGEGYDVSFDATAGTITVTLPNAILFDSGKANLRSATSKELDHIYSVLKAKYPGREIEVAGHTDTDPITKSKWTDNWALSAERALTVTRYLVKKGIPDGRIKAVGCGSARPVAPNTNAAGKQKNRRVEIIVHMMK